MADYIDKNLVEGEHVLYRARLHWIVLFRHPILYTLILIAGVYLTFHFHASFASWYVRYPLSAVAFLTFISAFIAYLHYASSEFGVTNKRVILKAGIVRTHTLEIFLNKIEAISVDSTLLGKILGFGSIIVTGTGGTKERFDRIHGAAEFQKRTEAEISRYQEPGQPAAQA
jgi:uncharacterized membrane protein YdbT with pleckstrin-like domain